MSASWVLAAILVGAPLAGGGYVLSLGVRELRAAYRTASDDPIPIADAAQRDGPVAIEGTAVPDPETLTAPFSGAECLSYTYGTHEKIDVRNSMDALASGRERTDDEWAILDAGEAAVAFFVEDETGRVRVDPTDADLRFETETYDPVPWRDLPDPLAEYVDSTDVVDRRDLESFVRWLKTPALRFREGRLEPGDSVYVRGPVRRNGDAAWGSESDSTVRDGPTASALVVADTGQRGVSWRDARTGLLYVGMSVCFFLATGLVALSLL